MAARGLAGISSSAILLKSIAAHQPKAKCLLVWKSHRIIWPTVQSAFYCSHAVDDVTVSYHNGLPVISVPLPSRIEKCQFTLKPISHTVSDFITFLQEEDKGIDRAAIYTEDGTRIAKSTSVDILMQNSFKLCINDRSFTVAPPAPEGWSHESVKEFDDIKERIAKIYSDLNVEEYQLRREKEISTTLENLKLEIEPLEKKKLEIEMASTKKMSAMSWVGLGLMGLQFGVLARLTWWEYSWDIMEPVTYFITYGTSIAMFAYFVLTRQEYIYPDVRDREYLISFHKKARKANLDVNQYNLLKDKIAQAELDLERLRDPLQLQLPIQQLLAQSKETNPAAESPVVER
ncbi:calcium uniporter protein, mitochondrial-like [Tubulanus polymorphus]|uniref:calcium uniporter protein, mitochondrial-like n=1 Tax=Tubulanus polymorphus TaxID=672921 RepID=UPI003DA3F7FE